VTRIWVRATRSDELTPGDVRVVRLPADSLGRPREALVLRDADGALRAFLNRCEHLPIPLDGGSRQFLDATGTLLRCGTHGALFRREDGYCVHGPCRGRSLVALTLRVEEGWVEVDGA
jgi:nitrite reductase/ring-hydroxylating ferredoxin subunit